MTDAPPAALFAVEMSRVWNEGGNFYYDQGLHIVGRIQGQQGADEMENGVEEGNFLRLKPGNYRLQ